MAETSITESLEDLREKKTDLENNITDLINDFLSEIKGSGVSLQFEITKFYDGNSVKSVETEIKITL